jgi:hypothetical protein
MMGRNSDGHSVPPIVRPDATSSDCRNATATNRYPVFGDGSVNCLTHFEKVFSGARARASGPAIFKTGDARTAFHSASCREQRDTLRRRLREDLGPHFSASSSPPKRLDANGEMYISLGSRHITLVDKAMSDGPQIVTRTGEGGWSSWFLSRSGCTLSAVTAISSNSSSIRRCVKMGSRSNASGTTRATSNFDRLSSRHECHL